MTKAEVIQFLQDEAKTNQDQADKFRRDVDNRAFYLARKDKFLFVVRILESWAGEEG